MSTSPTEETFDYVVVGGGSAGCVIAARLSEDPSVRVLLLERGFDVTERRAVTPPDFTTVLTSREPPDVVPVESLVTFEPLLPNPFGQALSPRALGGGPAVSGSFWGRGDPSNYDEWAAMGNEGWSYRDLLPFFKRSESVRNIFNAAATVSADRGHDGPIEVTSLDDTEPAIQKLWESACASFGLRRVADHSTADGLEGVGPMFRSLGHDRSRAARSTPYTGYIKPVLASRPNLTVASMATASRITFSADGRRAEGVDYLQHGRGHHAKALREVVIAAGALNSPKLLLQSGVGPGAELASVGVTAVRDLAGVGRNLQDHFTDSAVYLLNPGVTKEIDRPSSPLIAFLKSPGSEVVDLEIAFSLLPPGNILAVVLFCVRNTFRGAVRLDSTDPLAPARLGFALDPNGPDVAKMAWLHRKIRSWLLEGGLAMLELTPGLVALPNGEGDGPWHAWFAKKLQSLHHAAGTCRMGPASDAESVVDARLRVHGIDNLRVADCSIMPRLVSTHPSATAVMIGEKAASMILEDARR